MWMHSSLRLIAMQHATPLVAVGGIRNLMNMAEGKMNEGNYRTQDNRTKLVYEIFDLLRSKSNNWFDIGREMMIAKHRRDSWRKDATLTDEHKLEIIIDEWLTALPLGFKCRDSLITVLTRLDYQDVIGKVTESKYLNESGTIDEPMEGRAANNESVPEVVHSKKPSNTFLKSISGAKSNTVHMRFRKRKSVLDNIEDQNDEFVNSKRSHEDTETIEEGYYDKRTVDNKLVSEVTSEYSVPPAFLHVSCGCGKCTIEGWRTGKLCGLVKKKAMPKLLIVDPGNPRVKEHGVFKITYDRQHRLLRDTYQIGDLFIQVSSETWECLKQCVKDGKYEVEDMVFKVRNQLGGKPLKMVSEICKLQTHFHSLHVDWFNFGLLHYLAETYLKDNNDLMTSWKHYKDSFVQYCSSRNLCDYINVFFDVKNHDNIFLLEVDECYDKFTLADIELLRKSLSLALGPDQSAECFHLVTVREGSLIIYFRYCYSNYLMIFKSLTTQQLQSISQIESYKILSLTDLHNQFTYDNIQKYNSNGGYDKDIFLSPPPEELQCIVCSKTAREPLLLSCCEATMCKCCESYASTFCPKCYQKNPTIIPNKDVYDQSMCLKVKCTKKDSCNWTGKLADYTHHIKERCPYHIADIKQTESVEAIPVQISVFEFPATPEDRELDMQPFMHTMKEQEKEVELKLKELQLENEKHKSKVLCLEREQAEYEKKKEGYITRLNAVLEEKKSLQKQLLEKIEQEKPAIQGSIPPKQPSYTFMYTYIITVIVLVQSMMLPATYYHGVKHTMEEFSVVCKAPEMRMEKRKLDETKVYAIQQWKDESLYFAKLNKEGTLLEKEDWNSCVKLKKMLEEKEKEHIEEISKLKEEEKRKTQEIKSRLNRLEKLQIAHGFEKPAFPDWYIVTDSSNKVLPCIRAMADYSERRSNKLSWYSSPFHTTAVGGYKLRLKVHTSGNHIGVGIVLMRGPDNDDKLMRWPYNGSITVRVRLLNWRRDENHIDHTFTAIPTNDFAQSPVLKDYQLIMYRSDFVSHNHLEKDEYNIQYLKDDVMSFIITLEGINGYNYSTIPKWYHEELSSLHYEILPVYRTIQNFHKTRVQLENDKKAPVLLTDPFYTSSGGYEVQLGFRIITEYYEFISLEVFICSTTGPNGKFLFTGILTMQILNWKVNLNNINENKSKVFDGNTPIKDREQDKTRKRDGLSLDCAPLSNIPFLLYDDYKHLLSNVYEDMLSFKISFEPIIQAGSPVPSWIHDVGSTSATTPCTRTLYSYSAYKKTSSVWYSKPFYQVKGYKLRLKVFANGISNGRGTHLSLSVILIKDDHDQKQYYIYNDHNFHKLFSAAITVELLNWSSDSNHIKKTIYYNETRTQIWNENLKESDNFLAGSNDPNIFNILALMGPDEPTFISHNELEDSSFITNDKICFRISNVICDTADQDLT